ncbi:MAG: sigma-70 family RNA polymerase sigma factor [Planctomycetaceae bacterium]|nr:sigma-70 family RNA polymerase sigma factor [Planctomycetaceae bacterium]
MQHLTKMIKAAQAGETQAAESILPLVYQALRQLASQKFAAESAGHSLHPTLLVHEAYLRLVDVGNPQEWNGRGHFYAAAAEAMRRILIEHARRKRSLKYGGDWQQVEWDTSSLPISNPKDDLLAVDEALTRLEEEWPAKAQLVKLRYFTGMTVPEAAQVMKISVATAERYWKFSRAWLHAALQDDHSSDANNA